MCRGAATGLRLGRACAAAGRSRHPKGGCGLGHIVAAAGEDAIGFRPPDRATAGGIGSAASPFPKDSRGAPAKDRTWDLFDVNEALYH